MPIFLCITTHPAGSSTNPFITTIHLNDLTSAPRVGAPSHAALCEESESGPGLNAIATTARSALAQGPGVPTTVPIPNSGQEQVEPGGGELRIRQLPESVWQVAPMTGAGGS